MKKREAHTVGRPKRKPWWSRLFHFVILPPVRRLILIIVFLGLFFWRKDAILSWISSVVTSTVLFFGWGLFFLAGALGALVWVIWRRKIPSAIYHWNQWVGAVAFALVAWGILAFVPGGGLLSEVSLGGKFGQAIILSPDFVGALRLVGLLVLGIVVVAPGACLRWLKSSVVWLSNEAKLRFAALQRRVRLPRRPPPRATPQAEPEAPTLETLATPELKQVAQEVWKKYGQSSELTTINGWRLPPIDILDRSPEVEFSQADNAQRAKLIEEALASYQVEAKVVQINVGPTVTQFGVEPGWDRKMKEIREKDKDGNVKVRLQEVAKTRVKVERITSLANDLALVLAAPSIRIEAPVPGKSVVGIEVPNTTWSMVSLRGAIETSPFQKIAAKSNLALALGKGTGGETVAAGLAQMPHLLIAGATGSGKTVCLNTIICCLLMRNTPNNVRFIMIDPKRVELTSFNSIPHLATPVIVDTTEALSILRWLNREMDSRYQKLAAAGARNIEGYNKSKQGQERLPYLILVIDELADLMMTSSDEVEQILCRLAQLARATGIHLVVATQRPSVDVVTGLIKANFPTRISFAVTSQVDSRTILDMVGAEKLLGRGDMLYMPPEAAKPKRLQGCFVSDTEIERLVYFWNSQQRTEVASLRIDELVPPHALAQVTGVPQDPLLEAVRQLAREHKHISASFLQRKLRLGYPRAARLMELLEAENPPEEKG